MQQFLSKLTPVSGGSLAGVLTRERINALQDSVKALANGENISTSGGLRKSPGDGRVSLAIPAAEMALAHGPRFLVTWQAELQRIYVSEGAVAWVTLVQGSDSSGLIVLPEVPTLDNVALDVTAPTKKPFFDVGADGEKLVADTDYEVRVLLEEGKCRMQIGEADSGSPDAAGSGDGDATWVVATLRFKDAEDGGDGLVIEELKQVWKSDIAWYVLEEDSSSSSSSESSGGSSAASSEDSSDHSSGGSSGESSAASSGGADSSGGDSGSSKDTAIVPTPQGYRKWYAMESADVRFFDFMEVDAARGLTRAAIEPLALFCMERGSVRAFVSAERGRTTARVVGAAVEIRSRHFPWPRRQRVQVMLCGVRRGFAGIRMAAATFEEFLDNECRLNPRLTRAEIRHQLAVRGITE